MSILKNLLGAFVEFKEDTPGSATKDGPEAKNQSLVNEDNMSSAGDIINPPSSSYSSSSTSEYQKHFENLIEEANAKNPLFQGTDFKEFIDSKADVDAINDEGTKYRTAFNVLKRTGLTKEKLVTTGREYINIIDRDVKAFEAVYLQQYKTDVEQKEQLLQQKTKELQILNEKIAALNQDIKQTSQQIIQSKDKLNSNKNLFVAASENKKKEIKAELQKIEQYF
jgi:chromosome segregation ATPase